MSEQVRLLFVYNADSGLFNTISDIAHKMFSPRTYSCSLCAATHGYFTEKKEWREFIEALPVECTYMHRDEFLQLYQDDNTPLPAVFRQQGKHLTLCLDSATLGHCSNLDELTAKIMQHCLRDVSATDASTESQ